MPQIIEVPGMGEVEFPDDMTDKQITAVIRKQSAPQQPFPDIYGGAGGYNPLLSSVAGLTQRTGQSLGMTPENVANPVANAVGPLESATQAVTGALATPISGLAGLLVKDRSGKLSQADIVNSVQSTLTYQPRTGAGAGMSRVANAPMEAYSAGTNYLGEKTTDLTGSPALGAAVKTLGDVAPSVLGARSLPKRPTGPRPNGTYTRTVEQVPTTEQLNAASDVLYKAADNSGVVIRPESTAKAAEMIQRVADSENLGKLPPKLKEAHDVLVERAASGKPLSLKDADKARGLINDAARSMDPGDQRLAAIVKSGYDDFLNNLGPGDTLAGDATQGVNLLKEARSMWSRKSNSETLDAIQRNAEVDGESKYTQAGTEHALRNEFKKLYKSEDAQRFMTPEQLRAVRKVAAPGAGANALRNFGKMDPSRGGMAATINTVVGGGLGAGLGALFGGLPGAAGGGIIGKAVLGTAANLANSGALRGTMARVAKAREALVGKGLSTSGLLAKDNPMPLVSESQGLLGRMAPPAARSLQQIRADIQSLDAEVQRLSAAGPSAATVRAAVESELARLRRELAAAEAQGGSP